MDEEGGQQEEQDIANGVDKLCDVRRVGVVVLTPGEDDDEVEGNPKEDQMMTYQSTGLEPRSM